MKSKMESSKPIGLPLPSFILFSVTTVGVEVCFSVIGDFGTVVIGLSAVSELLCIRCFSLRVGER